MIKIKAKKLLPAVLWAIIITIVSSIPNLSTKGFRFTMIDKVAHFSEYFILGLFTARAAGSGFGKPSKVFWVSMILVAVYGILDELHQLFIPGRSTEVLDMTADVLGALAASAIYVRFIWKKPEQA